MLPERPSEVPEGGLQVCPAQRCCRRLQMAPRINDECHAERRRQVLLSNFEIQASFGGVKGEFVRPFGGGVDVLVGGSGHTSRYLRYDGWGGGQCVALYSQPRTASCTDRQTNRRGRTRRRPHRDRPAGRHGARPPAPAPSFSIPTPTVYVTYNIDARARVRELLESFQRR